jgi:receptor expression-enhancing protein 5/6
VLRSEYTLITCALGQSQLTKYPVLTTFEQRTQVPKSYAVLGGITLLTILHLINPLAAPVSNLVGWALPAYLSFKAIESPSSQDDIQWLTYWVVFGFFNFLESFALRVVLYYFPWYFAFKTVFILWLQLPAFRVSFPAFQPPIVLCLILFYSRIFPMLTLLCSLRAHKSLILPS